MAEQPPCGHAGLASQGTSVALQRDRLQRRGSSAPVCAAPGAARHENAARYEESRDFPVTAPCWRSLTPSCVACRCLGCGELKAATCMINLHGTWLESKALLGMCVP
eukprot:5148273-Prymnesium_polylepis.1